MQSANMLEQSIDNLLKSIFLNKPYAEVESNLQQVLQQDLHQQEQIKSIARALASRISYTGLAKNFLNSYRVKDYIAVFDTALTSNNEELVILILDKIGNTNPDLFAKIFKRKRFLGLILSGFTNALTYLLARKNNDDFNDVVIRVPSLKILDVIYPYLNLANFNYSHFTTSLLKKDVALALIKYLFDLNPQEVKNKLSDEYAHYEISLTMALFFIYFGNVEILKFLRSQKIEIANYFSIYVKDGDGDPDIEYEYEFDAFYLANSPEMYDELLAHGGGR